ncbi:MAG: 16S rRNA processing protein RimM [Gammaproteobacteria bacterium RIFCSPHIGHO2_12_FULL_35_23]|nr:MAG: 16S rRNA processing protein RimM [Gammaproteobacteria bacterium RIFCSPHIGHO2_12_FULL_35_23]
MGLELTHSVIIGSFASPHGVKGWIKINSATEPTSAILNYQPWLLATAAGWQPIKLIDTKLLGNHLIALLENYHDRESVAELTGKHIATLRSQLPKLSAKEIYWADLEGLEVINQAGVKLGKVDYLFATGANDILVVVGEKRYLIPYRSQQTVIKVDLENKQLLVDWDLNF